MDEIIEEMFKETKVYTRKVGGSRRYYGQEKWYRVLWDILHPESPCRDYDVHHIDGDKLNDDPDNLQRLTRSEHRKLHNAGNKNMLGKHHTIKSKNKISLSLIGLNAGTNNPMARVVNINKNIFQTVKEAAEYLSVSSTTIIRRIKANKPGYSYLN